MRNIKVTDTETHETRVLTEGQFEGEIQSLMTDYEVEALYAGDIVCVDIGDAIVDCEVVR